MCVKIRYDVDVSSMVILYQSLFAPASLSKTGSS